VEKVAPTPHRDRGGPPQAARRAVPGTGQDAHPTDGMPASATGPRAHPTGAMPAPATGPRAHPTGAMPAAATGPRAHPTDAMPAAATGPRAHPTGATPAAATGPRAHPTGATPAAATDQRALPTGATPAPHPDAPAPGARKPAPAPASAVHPRRAPAFTLPTAATRPTGAPPKAAGAQPGRRRAAAHQQAPVHHEIGELTPAASKSQDVRPSAAASLDGEERRLERTVPALDARRTRSGSTRMAARYGPHPVATHQAATHRDATRRRRGPAERRTVAARTAGPQTAATSGIPGDPGPASTRSGGAWPGEERVLWPTARPTARRPPTCGGRPWSGPAVTRPPRTAPGVLTRSGSRSPRPRNQHPLTRAGPEPAPVVRPDQPRDRAI
jgi:hypothetical protein